MTLICNSKIDLLFLISCLFLKTAHSADIVALTPAANEVVPVDQPYEVTWEPDLAPTVTSVQIGLYTGYFELLGNVTSQ